MKKVKSIKEIKVVKYIEAVYCDKCGKKIERNSYNHYDYDWFKLFFGEGTEDGGGGIEYTMELCEDCSKKLITTLKSLGYVIREEEHLW